MRTHCHLGTFTHPEYTEPAYRVEMLASDAEHDQYVINFFRRLIGLRIKITPKEAGEAVRRRYLRTPARV